MPPRPAPSHQVSLATSCEPWRTARVAPTRTLGALVSPRGGTSRSGRLAPCHSTSVLVGQLGWSKPYPTDAPPSLTSDSSPPPRLGGRLGSFSSDRILSSGPRGSFPERDQVARADRRLQPTVSISQRRPLTPRLTPDLACPTGSGDSLFYVGMSTSAGSPDRPEAYSTPANRRTVPLPFVANPVIDPVSESTRVIRLDHSVPTSRRRGWDFPVRKGFHPPPETFRRRDLAFASSR